MTVARYRARGAFASGSATARPPGARPTGAVRTALPVIYQIRQDAVWWPAQALAAQGDVSVRAIPLLEWSTVMVRSAQTRPPWLLAKALQANGF
jgi:hypothetical protein